ncbi:phage portal protein [Rothia mucilaginosa]
MTAYIPSVQAIPAELLTDTERRQVQAMIDQLGSKRAMNAQRQAYYDQKMTLRDLGISLPRQFLNIGSVLGWPGKVVDVLADRIRFERFVSTSEEDDPHGLNALVADNGFQEAFSQAVSSALIHSCAFITVTEGDTSKGEPEVLWLPRSAHWATGIWNPRTRSLSAGLTVSEIRKDGTTSFIPTEFVAYFADKTVQVVFDDTTGRSAVEVIPNKTGRPLLVPIIVGADLRNPFGRSRISKAVMSLTDSAIRTIVRSEIGAEFYASPQRYMLGADEEALTGSKWSALTSRLLTISRDEEGEVPTVGQFPQISMQPHTDQLRQWASLLAAESQIPLDELGFPSDNPSSDSAIQSQRDPLRLAAERAIRGFKQSLRQVALLSVALREGSTEGVSLVEPWFAPTVHVSDSAAADAVLKQVQVMPWLAESQVILEKLGYDDASIQRLWADKRRAQASQTIAQLVSSRQSKPEEASSPGEVEELVKE